MTKPQLCVTVTAPTTAELRRRRDAVQDADLIELRLDSVADPDVAAALSGRRRPVIITCRPSWEGGAFTGSEEERKRLLASALEQDAEYVDLEWRAHFDDLIARRGGRSQGKGNNPGNFANDRDKARRAGKKGGQSSGRRANA